VPFSDLGKYAVEEWRPGVRTRLLASGATGASCLCLFEQWSEPGRGAPIHTHAETEEVLVVLAGKANVWLGAEHVLLREGESAIVPAGVWHGFENIGGTRLHTLAAFAAAAPTVCYRDRPSETLIIGEYPHSPHRQP
jgi:uncharacterized cupin superfamily protein